MECNKDEAVRARQIAEARMQRGEFVEALRFATKAKKLYSEVENITQIFTICEVHNAAQKKVSASEMDWYAILQIERLADEATIKKQYRRLALLLHPDKNKFAGAEAAFKLIGQANGVLSDQAKRSFYDNKFGASVRGKDSCRKSTCSNKQVKQKTFWTSCQHCNTRYHYCIAFVNATLRCQKCFKSFKARVQKEASMHGSSKPVSESTGGNPVYMKKCAAGVDGHRKGEKGKYGCVSASKDMESQTSKKVGSKRVKQSASDSGKNFKAKHGDEMKDAYVRENGVDPSKVNARRSSRIKQREDFEIPSKKPRQN
uniref:DnaJ isogeny subfamily B member 12 n=1 Tax=Cajanus cajan TaxID=3821 RepID=A0A151U563_CAJCA|nr:DnaJ isogeny subfamily B member 12 [Cajanus cajan]